MPCCFPKKLTNGGPFCDEAPFHNVARLHDIFDDEGPYRGILVHNERIERPPPFEIPEFRRDEPPILLPCAVCGRTFSPDSLERHIEICSKNRSKKRRPFDSAKQRLQGTELAEFLPKQETRRHQDIKNFDRISWKKKHDDLLRTIREARGEIINSPKQSDSLILSGAPTRANEKGTCPTCNRHFGLKAYDRHVAWCKDRITRVSVNPATNLAKERLEARIRYRAPTLKNRRAATREKYSPGSMAKTSLSAPALVKPKENTSMTNCNRGSPIKQKPAVVRRPGQQKESSPGPMKSRIIDRTNRKIELTTRPAWCSYVRSKPDFNLVLKARTGTYENYDPFLLAEQQLKDLLSDTSDQCVTDSSPKFQQTRDTLYPLSHSSAFVKYPTSNRRSLIAPPSQFDDLISDFSSDSTETNSITREVFLKPDILADHKDVIDSAKPAKELGRRVIIDKSKALGVDERRGINSTDRPYKLHDNVMSKPTKSPIDQTNSTRASSAPRTISSSNRKTLGDVRKVHGSRIIEGQRSSDQRLNQRNNSSLSGSNLSLSSIVSSSEPDVKRSNSMFDELMASFEEDVFPDLRSYRNNESFDLSSPGGDRQRNGNLISDEELSSPDSYKPQDHGKLSNDSAYSSTTDMTGRFDEDVTRNGTSLIQTTTKCKMSKFCHECGQRFPETAKFCCECGIKRLAL
ncbi:uncharacterized protein LOC105285127 isoform X2 [Ooceraea biroi]|uniref:uncharacterized protein LOC105285127 isoform X2 n=1 Tax=Ooceraea biroi TaxID=2015173 RepID=UPI000F089B59|nr:uncharacterized protein LOC105285127 isoform X2 [Ooceraea biroi]